MLLGRGKELEYLNQYYCEEGNRMIVLYGQKGIGVSTLLQTFGSDKFTVLLSCSCASSRQMAYLWAKSLRSQGIPNNSEYPDFYELFESLLQYVVKNESRKLVLCIDQFHEVLKTDRSLMDAICKLMKEERYYNSFMIILSSNAIGYVENSLISQIGSLAFQISAFLKLKPLRFIDLVCYFDSSNTQKCMNIYSICGGNPGFWAYFDINESFRYNICRVFLHKESQLYKIGIHEVSTHLRELNVYTTLLASLAEGREKLNDIFNHTLYSRPKISVYLKNLMSHEYVEKVFSYEAPGDVNVKKGVYRISDPMLQFWFRFIYPHLGEIGIISAEEFYDKYIASDISLHTGQYFCKICNEYLHILNEKNCLPFVYSKCGEWIGKSGTIDIVAQNDKRDTLLGFCNYAYDGMTFEDYEAYMNCAKQAYLRPMYVYLFSVAGFDKRLEAYAAENSSLTLVDMSQL